MTVVEFWASVGDHRLLGDPGVDKKNIDLAEARAHLVEESIEVFCRSDIALEAYVFAAEFSQRLVDRRLVTANQRDSGHLAQVFGAGATAGRNAQARE